jgi:hypothetical protein
VKDRRDATNEQGVDSFGGMAGERGEVRGRLPSGGGGGQASGWLVVWMSKGLAAAGRDKILFRVGPAAVIGAGTENSGGAAWQDASRAV